MHGGCTDLFMAMRIFHSMSPVVGSSTESAFAYPFIRLEYVFHVYKFMFYSLPLVNEDNIENIVKHQCMSFARKNVSVHAAKNKKTSTHIIFVWRHIGTSHHRTCVRTLVNDKSTITVHAIESAAWCSPPARCFWFARLCICAHVHNQTNKQHHQRRRHHVVITDDVDTHHIRDASEICAARFAVPQMGAISSRRFLFATKFGVLAKTHLWKHTHTFVSVSERGVAINYDDHRRYCSEENNVWLVAGGEHAIVKNMWNSLVPMSRQVCRRMLSQNVDPEPLGGVLKWKQ